MCILISIFIGIIIGYFVGKDRFVSKTEEDIVDFYEC